MNKTLTSLLAAGAFSLVILGCVPSEPSHHRRPYFPGPPIRRPIQPQRHMPGPSHIPMPRYKQPKRQEPPRKQGPPRRHNMQSSMYATEDYGTIELADLSYQPED